MTILYAFEDVMNKIALSKLIIRPYEMMFYKAVFQFPLFIIVFTSIFLKDAINLDPETMTIGDYISQNSGNWYWRIVNRFSFIIANIFRTLSLMWVCEVLSPNHQSILKAFEFVVLTALSLAKESISGNIKDNLEFYIIELICCLFLMFASIIHNEIIVINRCNLMKSTDFLKSQINKIDDEIKNIELWRKEGEDKNKNEEEENILLDDMSSNQSFENGNEEK